jgi:hypothetical protein
MENPILRGAGFDASSCGRLTITTDAWSFGRLTIATDAWSFGRHGEPGPLISDAWSIGR